MPFSSHAIVISPEFLTITTGCSLAICLCTHNKQSSRWLAPDFYAFRLFSCT